MIRPAAFGFNAETALNNTFQHPPGESEIEVRALAVTEFDRLVRRLRKEGVDVKVIEDTAVPIKPDAVFPNNWISFHDDGTVVTYPMHSSLRRLERRPDIIDEVAKEFSVFQHIALEGNEKRALFLEGTGSMVLDRAYRIAYACISPRTDESLLHIWCELFQYIPFTFHAMHQGKDIYHTNVMMAIGEGVCIVCLDVVEPSRRDALLAQLSTSGRDVVLLRSEQIDAFAGNMMALQTREGDQLMVMSTTAFEALDEDQVMKIEKHARIVHSDVKTIETIGGGSVRCMIAENFLPYI